MNKINALIIGDIILDCYQEGKIHRISPEAPVPVVLENSNYSILGGAANLALNMSKLTNKISLLGFIGSDLEGKQIKNLLKKNSIKNKIIIGSSPTTKKIRIVSDKKQIVRIDREKILPRSESKKVLNKLSDKLIHEIDFVLISDYAKGSISSLTHLMKKFKKAKFLVDPKGIDWSKYKGAFLIKPNKKEFESVAGKYSKKTFGTRAKKICKDFNFSHLIVTLGKEGVAVYSKKEGTYFIKGIKTKVLDVTGAGDNFFAMLAFSLMSDLSVLQASDRANKSAAISIKSFGNGIISLK